MIYTLINPPRKCQIELLDKAILFGTNFLDLNCELELHFVSDTRYGYCHYEEEVAELYLNRQITGADLIATVFHELAHIKQVLIGKLEIGNPSKWFGKEYHLEYALLPWEQEATEIELNMMRIYLMNEELKHALKPFLDFADLSGLKYASDDMKITQGSSFAAKQITVGDLRRLAKAVADLN